MTPLFKVYIYEENSDLKVVINATSNQKYGKIFYYLNGLQRIDIMKTTMNRDDVREFISYAFSTEESNDIDDQVKNSEGVENITEIPNDVTEEDDLEYIDKMSHQENPYKFEPGDPK